MSKPTPPSPNVIGQLEFDPLAQRWKDYLTKPAELEKSFLADSKKKPARVLKGVGFTMEQMLRLVSTVGAHSIRAAFIIKPTLSGDMQFSIALSAIGYDNKCLSSYYLPDYVTSEALLLPPPPKGGPKVVYDSQVSNLIVRDWLTNWAEHGQGNAAYFSTLYGSLLAYTFDVAEFSAMFFRLDGHAVAGSFLELSFVLHHYWRSMPLDKPTQEELVYTFGLVLRLKRGQDADMVDGDDPLLDMGKPSPPY